MVRRGDKQKLQERVLCPEGSRGWVKDAQEEGRGPGRDEDDGGGGKM